MSATPSYASIVRELARVSDVALAEYASGLWFPDHLRELETFVGQRPRSVILLPRGHAKTTWMTHHVARRIGAAEGRIKVGIATASDGDALKRSRAIRTLVGGPTFAKVFAWARDGVASRKWSEAEWTVAGAEGYVEKDATVRAGSLYSLRPGPRFELLICDDIIGLDQCTTAAQREKIRERFWSVIEPMLTPDGQIIVLGTRWHEDDLYADFERTGWPVLRRAAISASRTALWPERWSIADLEAKRIELGSAVFDLQYQNDPSGMGGNIFRRDWFRYVERLPAGASRRGGLDLATSLSERSDYTALGEVCEDAEHNLYVCGSYADRLDSSHREWLTGLRDGAPTSVGSESPRLLWPASLLPEGFAGFGAVTPGLARPLSALNIEATTFQATFVRDMLRSTRLPARAVHPDYDKVTRARALAARYEAGKVFHLRGAPGLETYERELVAFPLGEHDDRVDAMVYAADLGRVEFSFTAGRR